MGLELYILGIRKLTEAEAKHLAGKTKEEMKHSKYFQELFPRIHGTSRYCCDTQTEIMRGHMNNVRHLYTPVPDADGNTLYVCWQEELAYYWHKNPLHFEKIEQLLEDAEEYMNWDESFHIVPYDVIDVYCFKHPTFSEDIETIAFLYG